MFTESEIQAIPESKKKDWAICAVAVPWAGTTWNRKGGAGKSAYPDAVKDKTTTIQVPRAIALETQKYAVWLARQRWGD